MSAPRIEKRDSEKRDSERPRHGELAQDQRVRLTGQAAVPGQEVCQSKPLELREKWLDGDEGGGGGEEVIGHLPKRLRPESRGPAARPQR
jgi:hypothetical protein